MSRSIRLIGWCSIIGSAIIIVFNLFSTSTTSQLYSTFNMFPEAKEGLNALSELLFYSRIWTIYSTIYFSFVLIGSILFVQFRRQGRSILEIACWIGCLNAFIDSVLSYISMRQMEIAISTAMKGIGMSMRLDYINPLGITTIIIGFFIWIIPCIGMIIFLRKPELKALMK